MRYNLLKFGIICLLSISIPSCKNRPPGEEERTTTACLFLECLKNDNVDCIKNMLGLNLRTIGKNQGMLEADVRTGATILKNHGLPLKELFTYDTIPRSYDEDYFIHIPIKINHKSDSSIVSAIIKIGFIKRLGNNKVATYVIETRYKRTMLF